MFAGQQHGHSKPFLSQISYDDFFDSEEKFTSELTLYTKKQFFEVKYGNLGFTWTYFDHLYPLLLQGIADMAGRGDKSRYDLLEISDPTSLLIRGR